MKYYNKYYIIEIWLNYIHIIFDRFERKLLYLYKIHWTQYSKSKTDQQPTKGYENHLSTFLSDSKVGIFYTAISIQFFFVGFVNRGNFVFYMCNIACTLFVPNDQIASTDIVVYDYYTNITILAQQFVYNVIFRSSTL